MDGYHYEKYISSYDDRRDAVIPGDKETTIQFCADHLIRLAEEAIKDHDYFAVALSGGSTPKAIYQKLSQEKYHDRIDWKKVWLFWSDERSVPPDDPASNYKMAMDAGLSLLPLSKNNIHRMVAEKDIEDQALEYEKTIQVTINGFFDLVMLGLGTDGHTASLFPKTHALHPEERLVVANFVPQLKTWRMTLTFKCINQAKNCALYVIGKEKAEILEKVLSSGYDPDTLPAQRVGTPSHKAFWIADNDALGNLYP